MGVWGRGRALLACPLPQLQEHGYGFPSSATTDDRLREPAIILRAATTKPTRRIIRSGSPRRRMQPEILRSLVGSGQYAVFGYRVRD